MTYVSDPQVPGPVPPTSGFATQAAAAEGQPKVTTSTAMQGEEEEADTVGDMPSFKTLPSIVGPTRLGQDAPIDARSALAGLRQAYERVRLHS